MLVFMKLGLTIRPNVIDKAHCVGKEIMVKEEGLVNDCALTPYTDFQNEKNSTNIQNQTKFSKASFALP